MKMFLLYVILALPLAFYFYVKWKFSHWQRKGVYTTGTPSFLHGSLQDIAKGKIQPFAFFNNFYFDIKKRGLKYGGVYSGLQATWVPVDQDLIRHILLKDFQHFVDHGFFVNTKVDPLTGGLFLMEGEPWRNHRAKLTPTFTSGKMKMMFSTLVEISKRLDKLLEQETKSGESIFIKEILARFTTDIIGSVAFGIDCNCLNKPDNEFRTNCNKAFETDGKLKKLISRYSPYWLLRAIRFKRNNPDVEKFFFDLVGSTVKYREDNNVHRKDFLQMMIELKNTGTISEGDTVKDIKANKTSPFFTLGDIVGHSFTFFLAGFETSSTTMTFALLELGLNPDIQEQLRSEILEVLAKHNGELTYDALMEMHYLEQVILETLRKYPPIPVLPRVCNKKYRVPGEDLTIEKGTKVELVVSAIHHDPDIFPNPEKFDPDRWSPENSVDRSNFAFLAFGEGPRQCIGLRFGKLETKVGLITILKNYKVTLSEKMVIPITLTSFFISGIKDGLWVDLKKLESK